MSAEPTVDAIPEARALLETSPSAEAVRTALSCSETIDSFARDYVNYPGQIEALFMTVRQAGVKAQDTARLERAIKKRSKDLLRSETRPPLRLLHPGDETAPERIRDVMSDAPISDAATTPAGFQVTDYAVYSIRIDKRTGNATTYEIAPTPVLITERHRDVENHAERVTVSWQRDGHWQKRVVERATIMDSRKIVGLADFGFPVSSNNARDLVTYLAAFDAMNAVKLPCTHVSGRLGWHSLNTETGYLYGHTYITASDVDGYERAADGKDSDE